LAFIGLIFLGLLLLAIAKHPPLTIKYLPMCDV
jgi:hypothetical protein